MCSPLFLVRYAGKTGEILLHILLRTKEKFAEFQVDGTDFKIYEPAPFNPKWWSHKLNCAGLRYEDASNH